MQRKHKQSDRKWRKRGKALNELTKQYREILLSFLLSPRFLLFPPPSASFPLRFPPCARSHVQMCSCAVFHCVNLQLGSVSSYINAPTCRVSIKSCSEEDVHFLSAHFLFLLVGGHILLCQGAADLFIIEVLCDIVFMSQWNIDNNS